MLPHKFSENTTEKIDEIYRNRLKTLLSVDDMVEKLVLKLKKLQLLERTHLIFTSDHGFHLGKSIWKKVKIIVFGSKFIYIGQFSMPWDKRQPYEFDIRVPLMMRGPGVPKNETVKNPALLIDLAPTLLQIAKIEDQKLDGISLLSLLADKTNLERSFLIEYEGESHPDSVATECNLSADGDQFFVNLILKQYV